MSMDISPLMAVVLVKITMVKLIEVRDKGIGMTLADQELVWEPFHRGRNGRDIPGTGLGLNITKHIVEEFGGTIGLASRTGAGTTVSIWLPAVKDGSAPH